jgi:class 3 adenylate cyclase
MRATSASHVYGRTGEQVMQDGTSMKRRLAAILAADIAGYSRLMGEDATVRDLKGHQAVILPAA